MADIRFTISGKFEKLLIDIEKSLPETQEKMLKGMAEIALPAAKGNLSGAIGNTKYESRSTGELLASLGTSPVKPSKAGGGYDIAVGFNEPRRIQSAPKKYHKGKRGGMVADRGYYTVTNAMLANILEHGKSGQEARPFMGPAKASTRDACIERARQIFKEEVKKQK